MNKYPHIIYDIVIYLNYIKCNLKKKNMKNFEFYVTDLDLQIVNLKCTEYSYDNKVKSQVQFVKVNIVISIFNIGNIIYSI